LQIFFSRDDTDSSGTRIDLNQQMTLKTWMDFALLKFARSLRNSLPLQCSINVFSPKCNDLRSGLGFMVLNYPP
jgi:hypothetical protein